MPLISLREISFSWGGPPLLDQISMEVEPGEKIGLVGRNGMGKSSLLGIFSGDNSVDDGEVYRAPNVIIRKLVQEVPQDTKGTVDQIMRSGLHHFQDWELDHKAERLTQELELDATLEFSKLSSGMKRRVLLAQALLHEPDVLLLDEPTNHLDIDSITWLESFLTGYVGTVIFVTHDRQFLQGVADRIIEIERGRIFDWTCNYETFLKRKEAALAAEERQQELFDKKLAEEEVWIRKGVKARRTRSIGRVKALLQMREERRNRRQKMGNVQMNLQTNTTSGHLVIQAQDISYHIPGRTLIKQFTTLISRGDKIGIIGQNGAGKSTLLKLFLKELIPASGSVRHGTKLEISYFDQLREQLNENKSIIDNISDGTDTLLINGQRRHIYTYLQDFLFTPERSRQLVKYLSGGERNRLLLAKLFTRNSNLLVLDEPTNDLDTETLELLEDLLVGFEGTLIVVSHDRAFLNNVVTSTIVLSGDGGVTEYIGGYDDYIRQKSIDKSAEKTADKSVKGVESKPTSATTASPPPAPEVKTKKLSYKEQRELEELPQLIEKFEQEQTSLQEAMSDPDFFKRSAESVAQDMKRIAVVADKLQHLYTRWETLGG